MQLSRLTSGAIQDLLSEASLRPEVRLRLEWMLTYCETRSIAQTCEKHGIARSTFYRWAKRFDGEARSLADDASEDAIALPTFDREALEALQAQTQRHDVREKLGWFLYYTECGSIRKTCKHFGIARTTFYRWARRFDGTASSLADKPRGFALLKEKNTRLQATVEATAKPEPRRFTLQLKRSVILASVLINIAIVTTVAVLLNTEFNHSAERLHGAAQTIVETTVAEDCDEVFSMSDESINTFDDIPCESVTVRSPSYTSRIHKHTE